MRLLRRMDISVDLVQLLIFTAKNHLATAGNSAVDGCRIPAGSPVRSTSSRLTAVVARKDETVKDLVFGATPDTVAQNQCTTNEVTERPAALDETFIAGAGCSTGVQNPDATTIKLLRTPTFVCVRQDVVYTELHHCPITFHACTTIQAFILKPPRLCTVHYVHKEVCCAVAQCHAVIKHQKKLH